MSSIGDGMRKDREYLLCIDKGSRGNYLTNGKIYIAEYKDQCYPIGKSGKRIYYRILDDRGRVSNLYGYRFRVLGIVEDTNKNPMGAAT